MDKQSPFNKKNTLFLLLSIEFLIVANEAFFRTHLGNLWGTIFVALSIPIFIGAAILWGKRIQGPTKEVEHPEGAESTIFAPGSGLPGLDRQPLWWQISLVFSVASVMIPVFLLIFGFLSYDYEYLSYVGMIPLVLLLLHKGDSTKMTDTENAQYDKPALSWQELLILLGASTTLTIFTMWFNAHVRPIDMSIIIPLLFTLYGAFAFFFMRRQNPEFEQEIPNSQASAVRSIIGGFLGLIGGALAFAINYLLCFMGPCIW